MVWFFLLEFEKSIKLVLIADSSCRFVGALLTVSQEYCFVIEGEEGVCGYVCSALDSADLHEKMVAWTVRMRDKYPKPDALTSCTGAERVIILLNKRTRAHEGKPCYCLSCITRVPRLDIEKFHMTAFRS